MMKVRKGFIALALLAGLLVLGAQWRFIKNLRVENLITKTSPVFNVKGYNCKGNGTANDTTCVANTVTDAEDSSGVLFFPKGTWLVDSLTIPDNVSIQGEGHESIIQCSAAATGTCITFENAALSDVTTARNKFVRDITFDGNSVPTRVVYVGLPNSFRVWENVQIKNSAVVGARCLLLDGTLNNGFYNSSFTNCSGGIRLASGASRNLFQNCEVESFDTSGIIHLQAGEANAASPSDTVMRFNRYENVVVGTERTSGQMTIALRLGNSKGTVFDNVLIEDLGASATAGWQLSGTVDDTTFLNTASSRGSAGSTVPAIFVNGATNTVVRGHTILDGAASWLRVEEDMILEDTVNEDSVAATLHASSDSVPNRLYRNTFCTDVSEATLTIPDGLDALDICGVVTITGTDAITTLNPCDLLNAGREVTIIWGASATFNVSNGNNLVLAGDFTAADEDAALRLLCDGTEWFEISRSAN